MSKVCPITGKRVQYGHNVSHANNKTKRRFMPNLQPVSFLSDTMGMKVKARLSTNASRSIEKNGGLDSYIENAPTNVLSAKFRKIKKALLDKRSQSA
ncbi:MAG: 50S ribosomal protein L28 [Holosporales bacterium]|jgi:large subunit ribosomal protein L28|nr:50S ribosomal protein L28 [Holosporales bacterium]